MAGICTAKYQESFKMAITAFTTQANNGTAAFTSAALMSSL